MKNSPRNCYAGGSFKTISLRYGEKMQVTLEQMKKTSTAKDHAMTKTVYRAGMENQRIESTSQRARDISSIYAGATKDEGMKAYRSQGKTMKDIQEAANVKDASVLQNKMVVMSHCVSSEEFGRMIQDGYSPESMDVDEYVTIVDRIKVEEAKNGKVISGYNDALSEEVLENAEGSVSRAITLKKSIYASEREQGERNTQDMSEEKDASEDWTQKALKSQKLPDTKENMQLIRQVVEMGEGLETISSATKKYLVENHLQPTLENVYTAQYSGSIAGMQSKGYFFQDGTGYLAEKSELAISEELEEELRTFLNREGIDETEEILQNAKWLVEEGIPITEETLQNAVLIDQIELPKEKEYLVKQALQSIKNGESPKREILLPVVPREIEANAYPERFAKISEKAVEKTIAEGQPLDLKHLERAQAAITDIPNEKPEKEIEIQQEESRQETLTSTGSAETIKAHRMLEEVRLHMTTEAAMRLCKQGIQIDTTELQELIEKLKRAEEDLAKSLFPEDDNDTAVRKYQAFDATQEAVKKIPEMPISFMGIVMMSKESLTLEDYYEAGQSHLRKIEDAKESYETYMTVARSDLGDSMKKAFRNMAEILEQVGVVDTEENERAARILAYNHLEITEEAIRTIREADSKLNYVVSELDPAMILSLIREGNQPMEMTLEEMSQEIDARRDQRDAKIKRFSEFLYELDQKKGITTQERDAFIDVYWTFHQVDKSDGAVIGALMSQGAELSLKNLKAAAKSSKKEIDYTVGDQEVTKNQYLRDAKLVSHSLHPDVMNNQAEMEPKTLTEWKQLMSEPHQTEEAYVKEQMNTISEASKVPEDVFAKLLEQGLPVSAENLLAQNQLMYRRGSLFQTMRPLISEEEWMSWQEVEEGFTEEESAKEVYDQMLFHLEKVVQGQIEQVDSYVDLKAMNLIMKQVSVLQAGKQQHEYEIPMQIGEEVTSVHLTLRESVGKKGKVTVTADTKQYGKMGAIVSGDGKGVSGYLAAETKEGQAYLESCMEGFLENLSQISQEVNRMQVVFSPQMDLQKLDSNEKSEDGKRLVSETYFQIAKAFLHAIH